ncbi:MAG: phosphoglycerate kinase [bacterium]
MKSIREAGILKGKKVMVRVDYNVPVAGGKIVDDLRIRVSLPTIEYLRAEGARIILISHIETKDNPTLEPIAVNLATHFPVKFVKDFLGDDGEEAVMSLKDGEVVLFENLRSNTGEKANDPQFARVLASYADVYVNDAFPVSHRPHASIVGIPTLLPHYAGFQLMKEVEHLSVFFNPAHPFIFVLGGAKFETKIPLIEKFSNTADYIFVGGALVNDIFALKGYEIGKSLVSDATQNDEKVKGALKSILGDQRIILPHDVVVDGPNGKRVCDVKSVGKDEMIVDVGPASVDAFADKIKGAKFILWNGPMGLYEKGFKDQTIKFANLITGSEAQSAVGGGDTVAAIESLHVDNPHVFISSGGGAMLEFLQEETLVGIEALK